MHKRRNGRNLAVTHDGTGGPPQLYKASTEENYPAGKFFTTAYIVKCKKKQCDECTSKNVTHRHNDRTILQQISLGFQIFLRCSTLSTFKKQLHH